MHVLRTTLLHLDEHAERARLQRAYRDRPLQSLLAVLDAFEKGEFHEAARAFQALPPLLRQGVHPVMCDVLDEYTAQHRRAVHRHELAEQEALLSPGKRSMLAVKGHVFGEAGLAYPRFEVAR